jgi:hypothetical protein
LPLTRVVTNCVLLQFTAVRWFSAYHTANPIDNNLNCVVSQYGPPQGGISKITVSAFVIRWVHYIHCNLVRFTLFTAHERH